LGKDRDVKIGEGNKDLLKEIDMIDRKLVNMALKSILTDMEENDSFLEWVYEGGGKYGEGRDFRFRD
jgi:hypothetical protein